MGPNFRRRDQKDPEDLLTAGAASKRLAAGARLACGWLGLPPQWSAAWRVPAPRTKALPADSTNDAHPRFTAADVELEGEGISTERRRWQRIGGRHLLKPRLVNGPIIRSTAGDAANRNAYSTVHSLSQPRPK